MDVKVFARAKRPLALAAALLFNCGAAHAAAHENEKPESEKESAIHAVISTDDTVGDVAGHPSFAGFGRLMLPRSADAYDGIAMREIGGTMPYHSLVSPPEIVRALNRMASDAADCKRVFYSFYTDPQKRADKSKEETGLFFFRGKTGAPFAIICPGGGFAYVGSLHEGFPHAMEISQKGFNAFVLRYRTGSGQKAVEDLAAALTFIFENSEKLGVGTADYSVWGSSAGARMAAAIGSYGAEAFGGGSIPKPAAIVTAYTGLREFTPEDPPTFAVVGERDAIARPSAVKGRISSLRKAGIDAEFREYPGVGHGFGLGTGSAAEGWLGEAVYFWERHFQR